MPQKMPYPHLYRVIICTSFLLNASYSKGQENDTALRLEEIIITAQKRAESMQDVPVSVASLTADKIEKAGIENLEDLTGFLTNIHFTQTGFSTQVRVRGIGSDNSQGFEQSVGMYIDGVYYGRAQLFRAPLMDIESAELLRGPQGTLLGKNSAAGALIINSAKPTDEFEGYLSLSRELEFDSNELSGVLSGPLSDSLKARLAVRRSEENGYFFNEFKQTDEPEVDETAVRLTLDWQANDNLDFLLKLENSTFDTVGRAIDITQDIPVPELRAALAAQGQDFGDATFSQIAQTVFSRPGFDGELDFVRSTDFPETSNNEINNITLTSNYYWNDHTITFASGFLEFDYDELCDCDFTPIETIPFELEEEYTQFSQEIRIASPVGERFEWIAGGFYQEYDQTFFDNIEITNQNLLSVAVSPAFADTSAPRDFSQDSTAWALFGQASYDLSEDWSITLGGRFTQERKSAEKTIRLVRPSTGEDIDDLETALVYWTVFATETQALDLPFGGFDASGSRDESRFLPLLNVSWQPTDSTLAYFRYTEGFKAGGFDPRSNSVGPEIIDPSLFDFSGLTAEQISARQAEIDSQTALRNTIPENQFFEFDNEESTSYELGLKTAFLEGRGEINLALFLTDYDNLQISQFDGAVGFNVGNANETRTQGLEIDGRFLIDQHFSASYGISFLDFEYLDFRNGNCFVGETPDGIDSTGDGQINTCDYTGRRGVYTPEYTFNFALDYNRSISNDVEVVSSIDLQYVDEQDVHVNLDPTGRIDAYTLLGARIGFESENWSVAIRGSNLLDEEIISYTANAPITNNFGNNTQYSFVRAPRLVFLDTRIIF